jgi:hypothetical protein
MPFGLVFNRNRAQAPIEESPAFAHVAERFRRAGELTRAVSLCRDGLRMFPDHVSGRVTLGLALVDLGQHADARRELQHALRLAPDNLAAIRGMAHLHDHGDSHGDAHGDSHRDSYGDVHREYGDVHGEDEGIAPELTPAPELTFASELAPASELTFASGEELASDEVFPSEEILASGVPAASDDMLSSIEMEATDPMKFWAPMEAPGPMEASAPMEASIPLEAFPPMDALPPMEASAPMEASEFDGLDLGPVDPVVRMYREALPLQDRELDVMDIGLEMDALDQLWSEPELAAQPELAAEPAAADPIPAELIALEEFLEQVERARTEARRRLIA